MLGLGAVIVAWIVTANGAWLGAVIVAVIGAVIVAVIVAVIGWPTDEEKISVELGTIIGPGIVAGIIAITSILYNQTTSDYFSTTILDSFLLIGAVLLAWLALGLMSVLLSARFWPWLKAERQAAHWICQKDYHRFQLGPGLPWPVRWSGRLLMVEEPRQHWNFANYFVCRYCGDHTEFVTARRVIGVIGATPSVTAPGELSISLFDPANRQARSADIDRLDLYPPLPDQTLDYDYAVNSVLNALSEDHHRSRPLKKIPVRIHGQLSLPENTRRMLADRFNLLTS